MDGTKSSFCQDPVFYFAPIFIHCLSQLFKPFLYIYLIERARLDLVLDKSGLWDGKSETSIILVVNA